MNTRLLCLLVLFLHSCTSRNTLNDASLFHTFMKVYGRSYSPSAEAHALNCFQHNLDVNEQLNLQANGDATFGINEFADLCPQDFKSHHTLRFTNDSGHAYFPKFTPAQLREVSPARNWQEKGAVTNVGSQGFCSSGGTFAVTGSIEAQVYLKTGQLTSLSEEEIVQCAQPSDSTKGCNGGIDPTVGFQWVINNGGIDAERGYPYTSGAGVAGVCKSSRLKHVTAQISSWKRVLPSEEQMRAFVSSQGPLAVGVDASDWQTYRSGILTHCSGTSLDHAALIVGYNTANGTQIPFWILKNSWGPTWGENGYVRVAYGSNQCGITQAVSTALA
eukprot:TRINITY_DN56647_c0_g1_i1.p1 TRINITY_DN56647_c0_g1~~TRINITY_DN56647_c0_g1_i1.p1  ORF type:complete len:331 (+),score=12.11 TRINITY_DN56647_c0_g1_i1:43-1035(+)